MMVSASCWKKIGSSLPADSFLPLPYIVNGDLQKSLNTLHSFSSMTLENVIQGHGDIILRGEIEAAIESNVSYLNAIDAFINQKADDNTIQQIIAEGDIELFGKERILLGGLVDALHKRNLVFLYQKYHNKIAQQVDSTPL